MNDSGPVNNQDVSGDVGSYRELLSAGEVRRRCHLIGEMAMNGNANWFTVNQPRISRCVKLVRDTCLKYYPDITKGQNIPLHSRWRHFNIDHINLWEHYTSSFAGSRLDLARSAVDLAFLSVLLDAGAGEKWHYHDPVTGNMLSRSEGLAAASIDLFFQPRSTQRRRPGLDTRCGGPGKRDTGQAGPGFPVINRKSPVRIIGPGRTFTGPGPGAGQSR